MNYGSPAKEVTTNFPVGELQTLLSQLIDHRVMYSDLLARLSNVGHKIEDTNYPQAENPVKKMDEPSRPGILADLKTQARLLKEQNEYFLSLVNKFEGLV